MRTPAPVSYIVSASTSDNEGFRVNSDRRAQRLLVAAGVRNNERRDKFVFALSVSRSESQRLNRTRIIDPVNRSNALGLVPQQIFDVGVSFVHPSQLRLAASRVQGARAC